MGIRNVPSIRGGFVNYAGAFTKIGWGNGAQAGQYGFAAFRISTKAWPLNRQNGYGHIVILRGPRLPY